VIKTRVRQQRRKRLKEKTAGPVVLVSPDSCLCRTGLLTRSLTDFLPMPPESPLHFSVAWRLWRRRRITIAIPGASRISVGLDRPAYQEQASKWWVLQTRRPCQADHHQVRDGPR